MIEKTINKNKLTNIKHIVFVEDIVKQFKLNNFKIIANEYINNKRIAIISTKFFKFSVVYEIGEYEHYFINIHHPYNNSPNNIIFRFIEYKDMIEVINMIYELYNIRVCSDLDYVIFSDINNICEIRESSNFVNIINNNKCIDFKKQNYKNKYICLQK
jgi:hypothetical protein